MRILFLSHYFPPEVNAPASRTSENCRAWVAAGHDVTVVTCAPNHPGGKLYPGYGNRLCAEETVDGIRVIRVWTYLAANEGFLRRTLNYVSYLVTVCLLAWRFPRADVVVSTSPQFFCGLAGLVVARLKRAPWVLEIRDLWPESIVSVGAMRASPLTRALEWLEAFAYRHADRIVSVTDSFVAHIAARGGGSRSDRAKIAVVKNGVDLARFGAAADPTEFRRAHGLEGAFVAAYVGTHGMAHGLETLLAAAKRLEGNTRIKFLTVGDGAERESLHKMRDAMGLSNVVMVGQLPRETMPAVWAATDASVILLRRSDAFKKVIPSKMFEAMAMRRPIVLGVEGEARALLDEAGAGIGVEPESADALADAVLRLADDSAFAEKLGAAGRAHVEAHFDRNVLAERYLKLLEETAAARQAAARPLTEAPEAMRANR